MGNLVIPYDSTSQPPANANAIHGTKSEKRQYSRSEEASYKKKDQTSTKLRGR